MAKVKFFTQKMIDEWAAQGKVEFDGRRLSILVEPKHAFELAPATRFLSAIEGKDQKGVVGKILTAAHLKSLHADVYLDSAIIDEVAYKVESGFVVDTPATPSSPPPETLLADFMLKKLSE